MKSLLDVLYVTYFSVFVFIMAVGCSQINEPSNRDDTSMNDGVIRHLSRKSSYGEAEIACAHRQRKGRTYCRASFEISSVTIKKKSGRCAYKKDWGFLGSSIWVSNFCDAVFLAKDYGITPDFMVADEKSYGTWHDFSDYTCSLYLPGIHLLGVVKCPPIPSQFIIRADHAVDYLGMRRVYGLGMQYGNGFKSLMELYRDPSGTLWHRPIRTIAVSMDMRRRRNDGNMGYRAVPNPYMYESGSSPVYALDDGAAFESSIVSMVPAVQRAKENPVKSVVTYKFKDNGAPMRRLLITFYEPDARGDMGSAVLFTSYLKKNPLEEKWVSTSLTSEYGMPGGRTADIFLFPDGSFLEEFSYMERKKNAVYANSMVLVRRRKGESEWTKCGGASLRQYWPRFAYNGEVAWNPYTFYSKLGLMHTAPIGCQTLKLGQNPKNPSDVNNDGVVNNYDMLTITNFMRGRKFVPIVNNLYSGVLSDGTFLFPDVNGDDIASQADIDEVLEKINMRSGGSVQIIDNSSPGFSSTGTWSSNLPQYPEGYKNNILYSAKGSGSHVATWTFKVTPGKYKVSATWSTHSNRATNSPYAVLNGSATFPTVLVNQEHAPDTFQDNGVWWKDLGNRPYEITTETLVIRLSNNANEYVIADAVRVERVSD